MSLAASLPFTRPIIISVLAFVASLAGGSYAGYTVVKSDPQYGAAFDCRQHEVTEVIDGDTIEVDGEHTVRLIGINAPELHQCYGEEAKAALERLVLGVKVTLYKDMQAVDKYGRLLRHVYLDSGNPEEGLFFVSRALVEQGHARAYFSRANSRYHQSFALLENKAEAAGKGLWGEQCNYEKVRMRDKDDDDSQPENKECIIKGNINSEGEKRYFLTTCPNYTSVKINTHLGEQYFCSEEEAKKAGFNKSGSCANLDEVHQGN